MLKLAPILKEISKDFRMGGHDGSGGHDGKLHQAFTLVMEWEAVEYLKVSRWDQKSQITTVENYLWSFMYSTTVIFEESALKNRNKDIFKVSLNLSFPIINRAVDLFDWVMTL